MTDPLPDMPLSAADIFVCRIRPGEDEPRRPRPALVPAPAVPRPGRWLVLELCPRCDRDRRRYCRKHDIRPR